MTQETKKDYKNKLQNLLKFVLLVFVVAIIGNLSIDNPYTHKLIRGIIDKTVEEKVPLDINFNGISVALIPPKAEVYGLTVSNSENNSEILNSTILKASVSLKGLALGDLKIGNITLENSIVDLESVDNLIKTIGDQEKNPDIENDNDSQDPSSVTNINDYIDRIDIRNLALKNKDRYLSAGGWKFDLNTINVGVEFERNDELNGKVEVNEISLQDEYFSFVERGKVSTNFSINKSDITLSNTKVTSNRMNFDGLVSLKNIFIEKDKTITLSGKADGDLSILGNFLDFEETFGDVKSDVEAKIIIPESEKKSVTVQVDGKGKANNATLYGFRLLDSEVSYTVTTDYIKFNEIKLYDRDSYLGKGTGIVGFLGNMDYKFNIYPKALRLSKLLDILAVDFTAVDGMMTKGEIVLEGTSEPFDMKVYGPTNLYSFKLDGAPQQDGQEKVPLPNCDMYLYLEIDDDKVNYDKTQGDCKRPDLLTDPSLKNTLDLSGYTDFYGKMDMTVAMNSSDLNHFDKFLGLDFSGNGIITTRIHGEYEELKIDIDAKLNDSSLFEIPLGNANAKLDISTKENMLKMRSVDSSTNQNSLIKLDGSTIDFTNGEMEFKVSATGITSAQVRSTVSYIDEETNISAEIPTLDAIIKTNFNDIENVSIVAKSEIDNLEIDGTPIAKNINAKKISVSQKQIQIEDSTVNITGALVIDSDFQLDNTLGTWDGYQSKDNKFQLSFKTIDGLIQPSTEEDLDLETPDLDYSKIQQLPFIGTTLAEYDIGAKISLEGEFSGTLNNPSGALSTNNKALSVFGTSVTPVDVTLIAENKSINMNIKQRGTPLVGNVAINLNDKKYTYTSSFILRNFNLSFILPKFVGDDIRNYLYISGKSELSGTLDNFWASKGFFEISELNGFYVTDKVNRSSTLNTSLDNPFKITLENNILSSEKNRPISISHDYGNIQAYLKPSKMPKNLDLLVTTTFDAAFLQDYFEIIEESEGIIIGQATLSGDISSPDLVASIKSDSGSDNQLGFTYARPSLNNMNFSLSYKEGVLEIENFTATKGSGSLSMYGGLDFTGRSYKEITLETNSITNDLEFPVIGTARSSINSKLVLSGSAAPFDLKGDIDIEKASFNDNVDVQREIIKYIRSRKLPDDSSITEGPVNLDINITANDSIFINNKSMRVTIAQKMKVFGNSSSPRVRGYVDVISGKFRYKKDYTINRGLVSFDGAEKADPSIDFAATGIVDNYKVTITITGRTSEPKAEFIVAPSTRDNGTPLTELDKIVLVSTGKLPEVSDDRDNDPSNTIGYEAANAFISNTDDLFEGFLNFTGQEIITEIYFDAYPSEQDGSVLIRANAPINTGNDLNLMIQGDGEKVGITAEYDLVESISTSASYSKIHTFSDTSTSESKTQDVEASVDLRFRFLFP